MAPEIHLNESLLSPDLQSQIDLLQSRIDRLGSESDRLAGTGQYPEWWYTESAPSVPLIQSELKAPDVNPVAISTYYQLFKRQGELHQKISGYDAGIDPLGTLVYALGADAAARGLQSEGIDGPMHKDLLARLEAAKHDVNFPIGPELDLMRATYGIDRVSDLLGIGGDAYADELRSHLHSESVIRTMRHADREPNAVNDEVAEIQRKAHEWMTAALCNATGISEEEAANYTFAASRRGEDKSMVDLLERFDYFGIDRLRSISALTGIHAFEDYSNLQLERMEELITDPEGVAERLADHDVQVVMINRFGDHNGVMGDAAEIFEDGSRTLFFEINSLADVYKHMLTLKKLGISPSLLAIAAHSAPGQFIVSDLRKPTKQRHDVATIATRKLVAYAAENANLEPGLRGYAMHDMRGMARIAEEFMQPSRALDDPEENLGKIQFVLQACHSGNEAESLDMDEQGEKYVLAVESVASRLGQDLFDSDVNTEVDIYGAPDSTQLHRSRRGARYTSQPATYGGERQSQHAVHVHVGKNGVTKRDVDEIPLRRAA